MKVELTVKTQRLSNYHWYPQLPVALNHSANPMPSVLSKYFPPLLQINDCRLKTSFKYLLHVVSFQFLKHTPASVLQSVTFYLLVHFSHVQVCYFYSSWQEIQRRQICWMLCLATVTLLSHNTTLKQRFCPCPVLNAASPTSPGGQSSCVISGLLWEWQ